jgi:histidinol-phosphatase
MINQLVTGLLNGGSPACSRIAYYPRRMTPFLSTALAAAEAAGEIIRRLYRENLAVEYKADHSPVTRADLESERAIRAVLKAQFPDHGFYGEETGRERVDADFLWLVDPIDGTKAFVRRYPMFSTQIALMYRSELIVGVSSAPLYGEISCAERGGGAWLNGVPVRVSTVETVEDCALSSGNLRTLASGPRWPSYGRLVSRVDRIRGYGDFLHYHLLASGRIDAVIESDVNILDIAALVVIVREAGGTFSDLDGCDIGLKTTSVLASNGRLHGRLRSAMDPMQVSDRDASVPG